MDFKPQTFFIGVIEFFSVLLPGALVTYFLMGMFYTDVFGEGKIFSQPTSEAAKWIIFLLVTYIIGNLVFVIASSLDNFYDKVLRKFYKKNYDIEVKTANTIQNEFIDPDKWIIALYESGRLSGNNIKKIFSSNKPRYIFNTFKWSKNYLLFQNPEAYAEVRRIEADSKFFRSLVIAFLFIGILLLTVPASLGSYKTRLFFVLAVACLYRFAELRYKSTTRAYELVITHYNLNKDPSANKPPAFIKSSTIKTELTTEFREKFQKQIRYLTSGFSQELKQVTIEAGNLNDVVFSNEKTEWWYCMEGKGTMLVIDNENRLEHFLQSNAIIPVAKGKRYSFQNKNKEPLQLMVLNN